MIVKIKRPSDLSPAELAYHRNSAAAARTVALSAACMATRHRFARLFAAPARLQPLA